MLKVLNKYYSFNAQKHTRNPETPRQTKVPVSEGVQLVAGLLTPAWHIVLERHMPGKNRIQ
jgi:hypothetical protein